MPKAPSELRKEKAAETSVGLRGSLLTRLEALLDKVCPIPDEWLVEGKEAAKRQTESVCLSCDSYDVLKESWKKAMKWTDGLNSALASMLASVASVMSIGDQLWLKIMGPASCGKSTLCEALSINKQYVVAKSTIRGFHSGFGDGEEDHSLLSQLAGKTLVTKDGDTLLQSPGLGQILSEARDIYDTVSRTSYRNKSSRDYEGIRCTWLLCGTGSLRALDKSELGGRFLDCVIMDGIDDDMEDEVIWQVATRSQRNMGFEANGKQETQTDPQLLEAMQLTGGYVSYLRENAQELLSETTMEDWAIRKCTRLGKFVAFMRARPSESQNETVEREFAARLVSQHIRLAMCLAIVFNQEEVNDLVMKEVTKIALDTSRGVTLEIMHRMYEEYEEGSEIASLATWVNADPKDVRKYLRFLRKIGAVKTFEPKSKGGVRVRRTSKPRWRLCDRMILLYEEVYDYEASSANKTLT